MLLASFLGGRFYYSHGHLWGFCIIVMSKTHTISLALDDLNQLFEEPDFNPFIERRLYKAGIDYIYDELKSLPLNLRTRAKIYLPAEQIEPDTLAHVRAAIRRYCAFEMNQNRIELGLLRWQGMKALKNGLIFLAICLVASALLENVDLGSDFLHRFLGEGLIIVGWVSLWRPSEIFLFEWWPFHRDNQLMRHIAEMEIVLLPHSAVNEAL